MIKVKLVVFDEDLRMRIGEKEVTLELRDNSTLKELLDVIAEKYGNDTLNRLLKPGISIMLNGQNIEFLGGMEAELTDGDKVAVIPPVFGG